MIPKCQHKSIAVGYFRLCFVRSATAPVRSLIGASCFLATSTLFFVTPERARAGDISTILPECAACHGVDGVGKDIEIPNLAGQQERYLYLQLQNFKSGRRPHKEMRYESRHLTDDEMRDLSHYYAQLPAGR
jgi:cytochrome c553